MLTKNQRDGTGEEVSVIRFDLDGLVDNPGILELLSKDAIRSGKADEIATQVAQTNEIIGQLTEKEGKVARTIADAIESQVGEFPLDLEEQSRDFVQSLVSTLQEQRQFVSDDEPFVADNCPLSAGSNKSHIQDTGTVATISRSDITGDPDATVAVFPTQESGLRFLKENEAWGFVRVGRDFEYVAMYVQETYRK